MNPLRQIGRVLVVGLWIAITGCDSSKTENVSKPSTIVSSTPLRDMKAAVRGQVWDEAWMLADQVLEKYPDDPEVLTMVAMVAHNVKQLDRSAELLVDACRIESYKSESRVQQAMIALVQIGRLHQSMELLESALDEQPMQLDTRRLLYDLCIGTEDRLRAIPHGQFLIRQRKFDLELLLAMGNTQQRSQETDPLIEMVSRNPGDIRPLVGQVRTKLDESLFKEAIEQAKEIIKQHPEYQPAQLLLGRALARSERLQEVQQWVASQDPSIQVHADYWLTLGDLARAEEDNEASLRCYWEATVREPDRVESWSKLSASLQSIQRDGSRDEEGIQTAVDHRVALLSELNQSRSRFERTGKISRAICLEIIGRLDDLGRLWEAEAWASIALTLPDDESVPVENVRQSIVAKLTRETPWQVAAGFPELESDFSRYKLPALAIKPGDANVKQGETLQSDIDSDGQRDSMLQLDDDATARGIQFLASTGDHLDEPGIMLSKTLGCGGGAIDFDLDGWCDLYLVTAGGTPPGRDSSPNALMRNLLGSFVNVTDDTNTGDVGFGQGVAVGDLNEDGFPDVLVLNYGPNTLYLNNGDGTFSDKNEALQSVSGPDADTAWSTSGAIADVDGDGISDIVILNYCAGLGPINDPCPMADSNVVRSCSPMKFPALADQFIQQNADGSLADRTSQWNAFPDLPGRGLGIVVGNLDRALGNEVFVANDMTNNHYWSRSKDAGSFELTESAMPRGLAANDQLTPQGSMGIACADMDVDGDIDCYVTNFDNEYNTFYEQTHDGIWQDRTNQLKLSEPTLPWVGFGTQAVDLENDGSLELIVTNGHVDLFSRGDEKVQYAQPMQIFQRRTDSTFEPIEGLVSGEYLRSSHVGRGLWTLDVDRDGRTDCVVTHQTESVSLLMNKCKAETNWLEVQLCGTTSARDAIGAVVTVTCDDRRWFAPMTSGDGYLCSNERVLRFGLGLLTEPSQLQIQWPNGDIQLVSDLGINQRWLIVQDIDEPTILSR